MFMSHNSGIANMQNNLLKSQSMKKPSRVLTIIDPDTGKNVVEDEKDTMLLPSNSFNNLQADLRLKVNIFNAIQAHLTS